jgi:hypothetical protein
MKIKSIKEAFSMQPQIFEVYKLNDDQYYGSKCIGKNLIKEIKLEYLEGVYDKEFVEYYVGYNFEGEKIFQYLTKSVNVEYFF